MLEPRQLNSFKRCIFLIGGNKILNGMSFTTFVKRVIESHVYQGF